MSAMRIFPVLSGGAVSSAGKEHDVATPVAEQHASSLSSFSAPSLMASSFPVVYWMHREFRAHDNWALSYAKKEAHTRNVPLLVCCMPNCGTPVATLRQVKFLQEGLEETCTLLERLEIPVLIASFPPEYETIAANTSALGEGTKTASSFCHTLRHDLPVAKAQQQTQIAHFSATHMVTLFQHIQPSLIITDFDSLREKRQLVQAVAKAVECAVYYVDSRNIVPCLAASEKREYGARTLRPKIHRLLHEYIQPLPDPLWGQKDSNTSAASQSPDERPHSGFFFSLSEYAEQLRQCLRKSESTLVVEGDQTVQEGQSTGNEQTGADKRAGNTAFSCAEFVVPASEMDWDQWVSGVAGTSQKDTVQPVKWLPAGEDGARRTLITFFKHKLALYSQRNDPTVDALSNLSPYLHLGMISAQRIVVELERGRLTGAMHDWLNEDALIPLPTLGAVEQEYVDSFVEELVVRRELSDNFCWYAEEYDAFSCFPDWAKHTLDECRDDDRDYIYVLAEWDAAKTHDPLWNAAQQELLNTGKIHGYMRMYWCKKILEWSATPEEALQTAIYLNDRYALDGCDSNGYTGIAWSIGGVHDRGWKKRPVYGSIRYMNDRGAARKFNVKQYIQAMSGVLPLPLFS